jgi:hypothetical protein
MDYVFEFRLLKILDWSFILSQAVVCFLILYKQRNPETAMFPKNVHRKDIYKLASRPLAIKLIGI